MTEHEQVAEIFRAAGWTAGKRDGWGGQFVWNGTSVVGGIDPWGTARTTGIVANPLEGPTNIVDAAHWLVEHARGLRLAPVSEPEETPAHEAHEETGAEDAIASDDPNPIATGPDVVSSGESEELRSEPSGASVAGLDDEYDSLGSEAGGEEDLAASLGLEILDADYTDPTDPPPEAHPSGAFIFGDNLAQMRTAAIGLVVQISLAKQEAIWAEAGAGPDEYSQLMSAVVRDTVDGTYRGDQATYDRFVALSTYDNAARRVQAFEREQVNMLTVADRATIEGFDPEAGWPA